MKIFGLTMITNPDYRQDPWRESIAQALEIFDQVVVVYGRAADDVQLDEQLRGNQRVKWYFLEWPQPDWSYEELPRHLNFGMEHCRRLGAEWIVKFDIDSLFHEQDRAPIRRAIATANDQRKILAAFEKLQFFVPEWGYEKGKIPLAVNCAYPVAYGLDETRYTDLCQPIIPREGMVKLGYAQYEIPRGLPIRQDKILNTGCHFWNYDYTFKTEPRARELLYHFDRAHAKWWESGYGGDKLEEITEEKSFNDYIQLVAGRVTRCIKHLAVEAHPIHIQDAIRNLRPDQFGHSLWKRIEMPGKGK